jgi:tRNA(Ile2) C34 agmatinyltransferase TiaS
MGWIPAILPFRGLSTQNLSYSVIGVCKLKKAENIKKAVCDVCGSTINADGTKPLGEIECTECSSSGSYIPEIEMVITTETRKRNKIY